MVIVFVFIFLSSQFLWFTVFLRDANDRALERGLPDQLARSSQFDPRTRLGPAHTHLAITNRTSSSIVVITFYELVVTCLVRSQLIASLKLAGFDRLLTKSTSRRRELYKK